MHNHPHECQQALALARGEEPVGPLRRTRSAPREDDRELAKRRSVIEGGLRRLKGFRSLFSRCETLAVLVLGCLGFALIIDALREW